MRRTYLLAADKLPSYWLRALLLLYCLRRAVIANRYAQSDKLLCKHMSSPEKCETDKTGKSDSAADLAAILYVNWEQNVFPPGFPGICIAHFALLFPILTPIINLHASRSDGKHKLAG